MCSKVTRHTFVKPFLILNDRLILLNLKKIMKQKSEIMKKAQNNFTKKNEVLKAW
jgi:hypothetical protein